MMEIEKNNSLKPYNTFGISVSAQHFVRIDTMTDLKTILSCSKHEKKIVFGGGSNILLTKDIEGLVLQMNIKGISILSETDTEVLVKVEAGENWHEFVMWSLKHNYGGVQNLALIPGNVGTAPIQNIGAYGVTLQDVFVSCEAQSIKHNRRTIFTKADCEFGYRTSVFKQRVKGQYVICNVTLKLTKKNHQLQLNYGAIAAVLKSQNISKPTIQDIANAVINIRRAKLPDPKTLGNSGSFFKNPTITKSHYERLKAQFETIPSYPSTGNYVKIPAAWLIETAGFKGKRLGDCGVHEKQALVLVNYGNATGSALVKLAQSIQEIIERLFDVRLEPEVNIL